MPSTKPLIEEAKQRIKQSPADQAHELNHHQAVWDNAKLIAQHIDQKVNLDLLMVACYWHDVQLPGSQKHSQDNRAVDVTAEYINRTMIDQGFTKKAANTVSIAIKFHEYSRKPQNTTGKILYDADKLEALSIDRWQHAVKAVKSRQMKSETITMYLKVAKQWAPEIYSKYHFDFTRKLHIKRVKQALANPITKQIGQELGIDWKAILQSALPKEEKA